MARIELPIVVVNSSTGLPVSGASVVITKRSGGALAPWYTTETGGTSSTSAVVTDSAGRATAWLDRGAYNLAVTGTGITPYTEPWDAVSADPLTPLATYTIATRPTASANTGCLIYVSDAAANNKLQYSDGTSWVVAG